MARARKPAEIYTAADRAVSRRLTDDARMEIISNIVMAVYDGSLHVDDIASRASEFVATYHREAGFYGSVSLEKLDRAERVHSRGVFGRLLVA